MHLTLKCVFEPFFRVPGIIVHLSIRIRIPATMKHSRLLALDSADSGSDDGDSDTIAMALRNRSHGRV